MSVRLAHRLFDGIRTPDSHAKPAHLCAKAAPYTPIAFDPIQAEWRHPFAKNQLGDRRSLSDASGYRIARRRASF